MYNFIIYIDKIINLLVVFVFRKFHSHILHFDGEGGWKLTTLGQKVTTYLLCVLVNTVLIVLLFVLLQEKDTGILAIEQPKDKLVNGIS